MKIIFNIFLILIFNTKIFCVEESLIDKICSSDLDCEEPYYLCKN